MLCLILTTYTPANHQHHRHQQDEDDEDEEDPWAALDPHDPGKAQPRPFRKGPCLSSSLHVHGSNNAPAAAKSLTLTLHPTSLPTTTPQTIFL